MVVSHLLNTPARAGSEISFSGSLRPPGTVNAGGRALSFRFGVTAGFAAGLTAWRTALCFTGAFATFGGASGSLPAAGFFAVGFFAASRGPGENDRGPRVGSGVRRCPGLAVGTADEAQANRWSARVHDNGSGRRLLGGDAIRRIAAHGADDAPGKAAVVERIPFAKTKA